MSSTGITLGRELAPATFGFDQPATTQGAPVIYDGEAPVTIIAPTGSGKGRDLLVPLLLTNTAPAIVIDIKGELSAVCARRRREMGHRVAVIDPFGVTGKPSDRLNPLDLLKLPGAQIDCDAETTASQLGESHKHINDPFWSDTGGALIAGLIAHAASTDHTSRSFATVRGLLGADDVDYGLAVMLDTIGKSMHPFARREMVAYLQICSDKTRPSVLSTARTFMKSLNSESVAACMEDPTIDLGDVVDAAPLDIFIVIPPEKVISHAGFTRLIIGTLLTAIMRRKRIPKRRTLLVADEAAQLGKEFGPLLTATTLMRGYGLQLVTVWQDVAQIKSRYKEDWQTILNNSGAIMTFGAGQYAAAKDAAEFLGMEAAELLAMKADEAAVALRGEPVRKIARQNYLTDERLAALADPNPFFAPDPEESAAVEQPLTWREKLEKSRAFIKKSLDEEKASQGSDTEDGKAMQAFMAMIEAIEEVGRLAEASPPPKKTRQRKPKGRDA